LRLCKALALVNICPDNRKKSAGGKVKVCDNNLNCPVPEKSYIFKNYITINAFRILKTEGYGYPLVKLFPKQPTLIIYKLL